MVRVVGFAIPASAALAGSAGPALAQSCTRAGVDVTCDDGRRVCAARCSMAWLMVIEAVAQGRKRPFGCCA
jgi:hypothetical protein